MRKITRPKMLQDIPEEMKQYVESVYIDGHGRACPKFYSAEKANAELRKFLSIGQPTRQEGDLNRLSDAELVARLKQMAKELGIEIDLSYGLRGQ